MALLALDRAQLPVGDSKPGCGLFLTLLRIAVAVGLDRQSFLKRLYLALPYS